MLRYLRNFFNRNKTGYFAIKAIFRVCGNWYFNGKKNSSIVKWINEPVFFLLNIIQWHEPVISRIYREWVVTKVHAWSQQEPSKSSLASEFTSSSLIKTRIKWTADLHDKFVECVNNLGGPMSMICSSYSYSYLLKFC